MIRIQENQDPRLEQILYRPQHNRKEFFNQVPETDIEQAFEEYLAGAVASFDMDPFEEPVATKIKTYIRNAPMYDGTLYRLENEIPETKNLKVRDVLYRRICSWTKSYLALKDMVANAFEDDPIILTVYHPVAINVEGYSGFYDQRESLSYGKFKVIKTGTVHMHGKAIKTFGLYQIGF